MPLIRGAASFSPQAGENAHNAAPPMTVTSGDPAVRLVRTKVMSDKKLSKGDKVTWETSQGRTEGKVVEKLTSDKRIANKGQKGTKVSASEDDPRYEVESEKTGKHAAHKPDALEKRDS